MPALAAQSVIDVRHGRQPRRRRDRLAREAIGVARAVPALVMMANPQCHVVEAGRSDDPLASLTVPSDDGAWPLRIWTVPELKAVTA